MERKADDPPPPVPRNPQNPPSSSSSLSSPDFLRHVQAALKRHRPLSTHPNPPRAMRIPVSGGPTAPSGSLSSTLISSLTLAPNASRNLEKSLTPPSQENTSDRNPRSEDISSHMTSLALAERERDPDHDQNARGEKSGERSTLPEISGITVKTGERSTLPEISGSTVKTGERSTLHYADPMTQGSVSGSNITSLSLHPNRLTFAGSTQISSCMTKAPETKGPETKESQRGTQDASYDHGAHGQVTNEGGDEIPPSKPGRREKASRKKSDGDSFFKVNEKLYQKLGMIGSGGSSEVYKVITSDCTIHALKKIILKGRDYASAYGFYQEIEYLKKLRGKRNIIQLIDYEVTDKALFEEVTSTCTLSKNGRIKDDVFIYMVLEYGEIDLANMLSFQWRDIDSSNWKMDENWLRFYWQQMLEAVNTIHEERIVHSDLKPANFLLVRGSLKLIDFGIAKAISSDTTNIQRDSQVGTLNYMSPEAYMCNEHDADGNSIKCGRPSDIWSLGCILYQMVYGKTPFADYKSMWAKYKVVTDRNHKISYGPVSNPWLIDLMKKCLAWDRSERWRIPQLLHHPFLVPPVPSVRDHLDHDGHKWKPLFQKIEAYSHVPRVSNLISELQKVIEEMEEG